MKEKFLYKERPFIYLAVGLTAIFLSPKGILTFVSSGLLIAAALTIFYLRNAYKKKIADLEARLKKDSLTKDIT